MMKLLYVCILFGLIFVSGLVMSAPEDRGIYFFKAGNMFPESNLDYARIIMNKLIQYSHLCSIASLFQFDFKEKQLH